MLAVAGLRLRRGCTRSMVVYRVLHTREQFTPSVLCGLGLVAGCVRERCRADRLPCLRSFGHSVSLGLTDVSGEEMNEPKGRWTTGAEYRLRCYFMFFRDRLCSPAQAGLDPHGSPVSVFWVHPAHSLSSWLPFVSSSFSFPFPRWRKKTYFLSKLRGKWARR